ncbi:MAG: excinuclease ABC, partial [Candidatus Omnitrophica bacterium]|nr:excinuclease ABC [Candidatus Omnitrophota bacterium]
MNNELRLKFTSAPNACGVYLMKDKQGRIIYIGKAKSLKQR